MDGAGEHKYINSSKWPHMVAVYAGISMLEVRELDYIQYLIWRRDAFIEYLGSTQEGQEYLDKAWNLEQTTPDREALRRRFGSKARKEGA